MGFLGMHKRAVVKAVQCDNKPPHGMTVQRQLEGLRDVGFRFLALSDGVQLRQQFYVQLRGFCFFFMHFPMHQFGEGTCWSLSWVSCQLPVGRFRPCLRQGGSTGTFRLHVLTFGAVPS